MAVDVVVWKFVFANGEVFIGGSGVLDGQVQGDHGVAAVNIGKCLGVIAAFSVGVVIPGVLFACSIK